MGKVVQNKPTKLQEQDPAMDSPICREAAHNVFEQVMRWNPLKEAAEIAAGLLISELDNADFFTVKMSLTEAQKELFRNKVSDLLRKGADAAVAKKTDYSEKQYDKVGEIVIRELIKIPEQTMAELGASVNRGALLAMTAVKATATNDERDEIVMWKSKTTGDITIPTRGVFISTNCVEKLKEQINFKDIDVEMEVK